MKQTITEDEEYYNISDESGNSMSIPKDEKRTSSFISDSYGARFV